MINCEKASVLISKKQDLKLSFWEKISLKFHTMMCSTCAAFEDETELISESLKIHSTEVENKMSSSSKEKLREFLKDESIK